MDSNIYYTKFLWEWTCGIKHFDLSQLFLYPYTHSYNLEWPVYEEMVWRWMLITEASGTGTDENMLENYFN